MKSIVESLLEMMGPPYRSHPVGEGTPFRQELTTVIYIITPSIFKEHFFRLSRRNSLTNSPGLVSFG